jgi:hypothetical protein
LKTWHHTDKRGSTGDHIVNQRNPVGIRTGSWGTHRDRGIMVWRVGSLARGRTRRVWDRPGSCQTREDLAAKAFDKQAGTDALSRPQKSCASRTAPRERHERDVCSKAILEKDISIKVLGHTPGRMGNDAC